MVFAICYDTNSAHPGATFMRWDRPMRLCLLLPPWMFALLATLTPGADALPEGAVVKLGTVPNRTFNALGISSDGKTIATWGRDHVLRRWDADTGKARQGSIITRPKEKAVISTSFAEFSTDGTLLAFGCDDVTIRIWDVEAGKERQVLHFRRDGAYGAPRRLAFAPDGKTLASYSQNDGCLRLWDVSTGDEMHPIEWKGPDTGCCNLTFAPDGRALLAVTLAATLPEERKVCSWDPATGRLLQSFALPRELGLQSHAMLRVTPDGRSLIVAGGGETVGLFELLTGKERARFPGRPSGNGLALGPEGRFLAIADDETICLWDLRWDREVARLRGHPSLICALRFTRDGQRLVSGCIDGTVFVWDLTRPFKKSD